MAQVEQVIDEKLALFDGADMSQYSTREEVKDQIAEVVVGGTVDLTSYVKTEALTSTLESYSQTGHKYGVKDLEEIYSKEEVDLRIAAVEGSEGNSWDRTVMGWSWTTPVDGQLILKNDTRQALLVDSESRNFTFGYDIVSETGTFIHCVADFMRISSGRLTLSNWVMEVETDESFVWKYQNKLIMTLTKSKALSINGTITGYSKEGHMHGVGDLTDVYSKTEVDSKIAAIGGSDFAGWVWMYNDKSSGLRKSDGSLLWSVSKAGTTVCNGNLEAGNIAADGDVTILGTLYVESPITAHGESLAIAKRAINTGSRT